MWAVSPVSSTQLYLCWVSLLPVMQPGNSFWAVVLSRSVVSDSLWCHVTIAHQVPLPMGILQARILEQVDIPSSRASSHPGIEPRSLTLQVDSLLSKPPGKPMNAGVGSLSLLQGVFLTQESNWGLLHCCWILYQLSYQGRPPGSYLSHLCGSSQLFLFS